MTRDPDTEHVAPVVAVFGAAGGIGSALCRQLAARGCRLLVSGRTAERIDALAKELGADPVTLDATDADAVAQCLGQLKTRCGRVDGVANCVGSLLLKPAHLTSPEEWADVVTTNLGSAFAIVRGAARVMRDTGGSVVLVSSAAARLGLANHEAIAAAKAGVLGLMRSAAASYARRGIRVNAVAPGLVQTALTAKLTASERSRDAAIAMHAAGRLGTPEDVAEMMAWLLDPAHTWVTGQTFGIDGGLGTIRNT